MDSKRDASETSLDPMLAFNLNLDSMQLEFEKLVQAKESSESYFLKLISLGIRACWLQENLMRVKQAELFGHVRMMKSTIEKIHLLIESIKMSDSTKLEEYKKKIEEEHQVLLSVKNQAEKCKKDFNTCARDNKGILDKLEEDLEGLDTFNSIRADEIRAGEYKQKIDTRFQIQQSILQQQPEKKVVDAMFSTYITHEYPKIADKIRERQAELAEEEREPLLDPRKKRSPTGSPVSPTGSRRVVIPSTPSHSPPGSLQGSPVVGGSGRSSIASQGEFFNTSLTPGATQVTMEPFTLTGNVPPIPESPSQGYQTLNLFSSQSQALAQQSLKAKASDEYDEEEAKAATTCCKCSFL